MRLSFLWFGSINATIFIIVYRVQWHHLLHHPIQSSRALFTSSSHTEFNRVQGHHLLHHPIQSSRALFTSSSHTEFNSTIYFIIPYRVQGHHLLHHPIQSSRAPFTSSSYTVTLTCHFRHV